jgi:hypothetical protein
MSRSDGSHTAGGMMNRALGIALFLSMLFAAPTWAAAGPLSPAADAARLGPAGQDSACSRALADRRWPEFGPVVEFEEQNVGPSGSQGVPVLCLVRFPREDVYTAVISRVSNVQQFRAAKPQAIERLRARGTDLCKITKWLGWGSPQGEFNLDDFYEVGQPCDPRVIAGDPGAEQHLQTAHEALAHAIAVTAADFGWRPDPPVTIMLFTDREAAAEAFSRYRANFESPEEASAIGRRGISRFVWGTGTNYLYGNAMQINVSDPNYLSTERIWVDVVGQYTRFAINQAVGKDPQLSQGIVRLLPTWFDDGLQVRQEFRHTANGASGGYLVEAARAARTGGAPKLPDLLSWDSMTAQRGQFGKYAVYAKSYATVSYLGEKHGEGAVGQLLRESRLGSVEKFGEQVRALTGLTPDGLDAAVTGWLLERPAIGASNDSGSLRVELHLFDDGSRGEVVVDETAAACLFDLAGTVLVPEEGQAGLVGFSVTLGADGSFVASRQSTRIGNAVTLEGRLDEARQLSGTYRVTNEITGCDSGAIAFSTR